MIKNPSFEDGWTDKLIPGTYTKNQEPKDWLIGWAPPGQIYRSEPVHTAPEMVHKPSRTLPPREHMGGEDPLILDGDVTYKIFAMGSYAGKLTQTLTNLVPGEQVRIDVPIRCHHDERDPYGVEASLRVGDGYAWLNTPDLPTRTWVLLHTIGIVDPDGSLRIDIIVDHKWDSPVDFFIDDLAASYINEVIPPEPEIPPEELPKPPDGLGWLCETWPTHFKTIWQWYGENKWFDYRNFGQCYHCGIDLKSGEYGEIMNVSRGKVVKVEYDDKGFGHHVVVQHNDRFSTLYAHMSEIRVIPNMDIEAGFVVGLSGWTGNVKGTEQHLHFAVLDNVHPDKCCHDKYVDPWPYMEHLFNPQIPPPSAAPIFDMLPYLRGDGRIYGVKNANGGTEWMQSKEDVDWFYQTKNPPGTSTESFFFDNAYIFRDWDSSPGGGRFYRLRDDDLQVGSRWCPLLWSVGNEFTQSRRVQFYNLATCKEDDMNSGHVTDTLKFLAYHDTYTFRTGFVLDDVAQLEWVNGGEYYFYAKNYGLVGWERKHFDPHTPQWSAIYNDTDQRDDNKLVIPRCV